MGICRERIARIQSKIAREPQKPNDFGFLLLFVTTFALKWGWQRLEAAGNGWNEKQR
jgi:hypothetical protein